MECLFTHPPTHPPWAHSPNSPSSLASLSQVTHPPTHPPTHGVSVHPPTHPPTLGTLTQFSLVIGILVSGNPPTHPPTHPWSVCSPTHPPTHPGHTHSILPRHWHPRLRYLLPPTHPPTSTSPPLLPPPPSHNPMHLIPTAFFSSSTHPPLPSNRRTSLPPRDRERMADALCSNSPAHPPPTPMFSFPPRIAPLAAGAEREVA